MLDYIGSKNSRNGNHRRRTARVHVSEHHGTNTPLRSAYEEGTTHHSIVVHCATCKRDGEHVLSAFTSFKLSRTRFQLSGFLDECHG